MQSHILCWWHWFISADGLDYSFQLNLLHKNCLDNKHIKDIPTLLPAFLACWHIIILHCIRSISNFCRTAISEKQLCTFVWYLQLCDGLEFNLTFDRNAFWTQLVYLCIDNLYLRGVCLVKILMPGCCFLQGLAASSGLCTSPFYIRSMV